jgi:hypothetical protein
MTEQGKPEPDGELVEALNKLSEEVRAGLRHGFFQCKVTCEITNGGKRRLIIRAGKSHHFIIGKEELSDR